MTPRIDVLLPVYRSLSAVGEEIVAKQIDSVLAQRGCEVRLLILDNASDDGTFEWLCGRYEADARVQIARNERNLGLLGSMERLLARVEAPYFAAADHDDVWVEDKLASAVAKLEATGADLVYSDLSVVDRELRVIAASSLVYTNCPPVVGRAPLDVLIKNPIHGCALTARREVASRALPFPLGVRIHDRWLGLVASTGRGIGYVNRSLVLYRQHDNNATGDLPFTVAGLTRRSRGRFFRYLSERLAARVAYLRGWMSLDPNREASWLCRYYELSRTARLLLAPFYALFVAFRARQIGLRNALADAILTSLAPSPEPFHHDATS